MESELPVQENVNGLVKHKGLLPDWKPVRDNRTRPHTELRTGPELGVWARANAALRHMATTRQSPKTCFKQKAITRVRYPAIFFFSFMGTSTWREMGSPFTFRSSLSLTGAAYLTLSCSNDAASEEKDISCTIIKPNMVDFNVTLINAPSLPPGFQETRFCF
ncbi:hypothetical protein F441_18994 [Phytophthora nicotianae CJ01A1]|uniref:Uncharacterized protein n=2 Tax=Phytophthora nicotianae TaxID=4792 RepID=W2W3C1_PHYNI|nr:hypothetical protein F444_19134 [Phytophthora nicotianae P1976]ETP04104.1 hypothetical protein F441_18994 [Phytophthora nicotianae CJ01A1]